MIVQRAKVLGFCFGVRRAVELTQSALESSEGKIVYSLGPIIHNEQVLKSFESKGLKILDEQNLGDVVENSVVIIRAHGVSPAVIATLKNKNCQIVDATCPRVKASQKMVEKFTSDNDYVILSGDKNHGEVKGIAGYAGRNFFLVQNPKDAESLCFENKENINVILLSQTTYSQSEFGKIENILKEKFKNLDVINTICPATQERQNALKDLCKNVDGILVIGGKESSNTKRLYLTACEKSKLAAHIQSVNDIPKEFFKLKKIGITAGASTPDSVIEEIEAYLEGI